MQIDIHQHRPRVSFEGCGRLLSSKAHQRYGNSLDFEVIDVLGSTPPTAVDERLLIAPGDAVETENLIVPFVAR
jgi:hypothetical protein